MRSRWPAGLIWEEKMDGVFEAMPVPGGHVLGERMSGGEFYAFDLRGPEFERAPLRERLVALDAVAVKLGALRPATGNGPEFLEAIMARGGEGVVVKDMDALPGATWTKIKRVQVFYGVIRDMRPERGSVRVDLIHSSFLDAPGFEPSDFETGDNGGWVAMGGRFEAVKIGDVLKLEAYGQHKSGLLREARLDKDFPGSWLVRGW